MDYFIVLACPIGRARFGEPSATMLLANSTCESAATDSRPMVRAELMGGHCHQTMAGVTVNVWLRDETYIARGRIHGQAFGETLGDDPLEAAVRLRQILNDIDNGSFVRATDRRKRLVSNGRIPQLTLRGLVAEFLVEKRQLRGQQTANDYRSRLAPVLDFAELPENLKAWPLAIDIDAAFARSLRAFLHQYRSTRNGRPGAGPRPLSARQIINILECMRTLLHWARSASVRKLPADWVMPFTPDIVGQVPAKNPLREDKLPLAARVQIVGAMDRWQLCHLALSLTLPLRPDEAAGLLIGDINFSKGWAEFGERFKDANFTKGRTAFVLPFPEELQLILRTCIGDRAEGPLLRSRRAFEGRQGVQAVPSLDYLKQLYDAELVSQPQGAVQTEQDRKLLFRHLLRRLGGVTEDALAKEFKKLLAVVGVNNGATLYTCRSSVTTAMHKAGLSHLEMRYLTGHATTDILNEYVVLDPGAEMQKYFATIRPLLDAIKQRAVKLGIVPQ